MFRGLIKHVYVLLVPSAFVVKRSWLWQLHNIVIITQLMNILVENCWWKVQNSIDLCLAIFPIVLIFSLFFISLVLSFALISLPLFHHVLSSFFLFPSLFRLLRAGTVIICYGISFFLHAYEPFSFSLPLSCFSGSHTLGWRDNTSSR